MKKCRVFKHTADKWIAEYDKTSVWPKYELADRDYVELMARYMSKIDFWCDELKNYTAVFCKAMEFMGIAAWEKRMRGLGCYWCSMNTDKGLRGLLQQWADALLIG